MTFALDHVALVVPDLDSTASVYRKLGFRLTTKSSHKGVLPSGSAGPWGTGNYCAMFSEGYFEILGITDPALPHDNVARRLARYVGLHLIAFGTADAAAAVAALRSEGVAGVAEPIYVGRDVPIDGGTKPGRFAIAYLDDEHFPEADFIIIEQQTPEVLWQPALLTHPNGVRALRSATVASDDPAGTIGRLSAVLGKPDESGFAMSPGRLDIVAAAEANRLYPEAGAPRPVPKVIAISFSVGDIEGTSCFLRSSGVPFGHKDNAIRIAPENAAGAVVDFVADGDWGAVR